MGEQLGMFDPSLAAFEGEVTFEIVHVRTAERKTVRWVAMSPGFVLCDWPLGVEMKFRCKSGAGVGVSKDWIIQKAELAKLKKRIEE